MFILWLIVCYNLMLKLSTSIGMLSFCSRPSGLFFTLLVFLLDDRCFKPIFWLIKNKCFQSFSLIYIYIKTSACLVFFLTKICIQCLMAWTCWRDLRWKMVIIVGNSLNRNQWEPLACRLLSAIPSSWAHIDGGCVYKVFKAKDILLCF